MRWFIIPFLILACAARAAGPLQPVLDLDFTRSDTVDPRITVTRADTATGFNCAVPQVLVTFPANTAATHLCDEQGNSLGMASYASTIFHNTWSNDLSQTDWHATNVTAAPNQPGIDANGATLLTATANAATMLQPQQKSAQFRLLTAFAKCVRCTGAVRMTQDGTHWTRIDGSMNTARFVRVPIGGLLQAVENPVMGFEMDNTGDQILVTYVNYENDNNLSMVGPSPPYLLTSSNFTIRPADLITMNLSDIPGMTPDRFTVVIKTTKPRWYGVSPIGDSAGTFAIDDGVGPPNLVTGYYQSAALIDKNNDFPAQSGTASIKARCSHAPTNQLIKLTPPFPGVPAVTAVGFDIATGLGIGCNNGSGSGNEPEVSFTAPSTFTAPLVRLVIGQNFFVGGALGGYIERLQIYPVRLQGGQLMSIINRLNPATPPRVVKYFAGNGGTGRLLFNTGEPLQCSRCP